MAFFSYAQKLRELRRELAMRKRVYPRWVDDGRLKQADADMQIIILEAVIDDIIKLMERDQLGERLI